MKSVETTLRFVGDVLLQPTDRLARRVTSSGPKWCEPADGGYVARRAMAPLAFAEKGRDSTPLKHYLAMMTDGQREQWSVLVGRTHGWPNAAGMKTAAARLVLGYRIRTREHHLLVRLDAINRHA